VKVSGCRNLSPGCRKFGLSAGWHQLTDHDGRGVSATDQTWRCCCCCCCCSQTLIKSSGEINLYPSSKLLLSPLINLSRGNCLQNDKAVIHVDTGAAGNTAYEALQVGWGCNKVWVSVRGRVWMWVRLGGWIGG
jgi:hypothetical protein